MINEYAEKKLELIALSEGARQARVSIARFSRLVKRLEIPVYRVGHGVLVEPTAVKRVKEAIVRREVRPGRPKKEAAQKTRAA